MYTMEYYSAIKKNETWSSNMDEPRERYAKLDKSDRERQVLYDFTCTWNLKNKTNKQTNRPLNTDNKLEMGGQMGELDKGD